MSLSETTKQILLKNLQYSPNTQYTSIKTLYGAVKNNGIPYNEVKTFIQQQEPSQLFKQQKHVKYYFPITAKFKYEILQMDLVDMSDIASTNENYKYLLVIIDVFSRFAFVFPLKNKTADTVTDILKDVVEETSPHILNTDLGSEFISNSFKTMLLKHGVQIHYVDVGEHKKLTIVDRFVSTLRQKINMYLSQYHTTKYIDVLEKIVYNYNNSFHTGIKKIPSEVTYEDPHIFKMDNEKYNKAFSNEILFNIGDKVRYIITKTSFSKGTLPKWSKTVHTTVSSQPHSYILENGKFYKYYELQKVPEVQKLEKAEVGPTRQQMVREKTVKRKFKLTGLDMTNILSTKRRPDIK